MSSSRAANTIARLLAHGARCALQTRTVPSGGVARRTLGTAAVTAEPEADSGATRGHWDLMAAREYEQYRRAIYGEITHRALLVDAVGTLVVPAQPMAQIYRTIGEKYGVSYSEDEILYRYRWAYEQPWGRSRLRYVDFFAILKRALYHKSNPIQSKCKQRSGYSLQLKITLLKAYGQTTNKSITKTASTRNRYKTTQHNTILKLIPRNVLKLTTSCF